MKQITRPCDQHHNSVNDDAISLLLQALLRILAGILPFGGDVFLNSPNQAHPVSLRQSPTRYRRLIAWADAEPQYPGFLTGYELLDFSPGLFLVSSGARHSALTSIRFGGDQIILLWPSPDTGNADAGLADAISHPGIGCSVVCWVWL
jgi:hypothetical protein